MCVCVCCIYTRADIGREREKVRALESLYGGVGQNGSPPSRCLMSSAAVTTASRLPEQFAARRYRGACGNEITLQQAATGNGAVEYVLRDVSRRRGFSGLELGLLCLAIALWTVTRSPVCAALGLLALAAVFKSALFSDRTSECLLFSSIFFFVFAASLALLVSFFVRACSDSEACVDAALFFWAIGLL